LSYFFEFGIDAFFEIAGSWLQMAGFSDAKNRITFGHLFFVKTKRGNALALVVHILHGMLYSFFPFCWIIFLGERVPILATSDSHMQLLVSWICVQAVLG
jgi:hypothetical protein